MQKSLEKVFDGLSNISMERIWVILQETGFRWQKSRSWCETGQVERKRKRGIETVVDPDATQKNLIELAYLTGEKLGLAVWVEDEVGPYQTAPYAGESWQPEQHPVRLSHEYIRKGTAKMLTLFHPATGQLRAKGVTQSTNAILHPWFKSQIGEILKTLPEKPMLDEETNHQLWTA